MPSDSTSAATLSPSAVISDHGRKYHKTTVTTMCFSMGPIRPINWGCEDIFRTQFGIFRYVFPHLVHIPSIGRGIPHRFRWQKRFESWQQVE